MKKKDLIKLLNPEYETAAVERTYKVSQDECEVSITFKSDVPMTAIDLITALMDFLNDFVLMVLKGNSKEQ